MEDLLILIAVISIIFGILQIILFCKIWGMTNDIRDLRSEFIGGTDQWTLRKAILKGDKNRIAELLFNDMFYRIKKYYNDSIPDPDGCKKKALEEQISSLKKEYKKKYIKYGIEFPEAIDKIEKQEDIEKTRELAAAGYCTCTLQEDVANLYIVAKVCKGSHYAEVTIINRHTYITRIVKDDVVLFEAAVSEESSNYVDKSLLNVKDILEFANTVNIDDVREVLKRQIEMNSAIADEALMHPYGAQIGRTLLQVYGDDVKIRAKARAAAGSDARMGGCSMPVVINSGSGNQGMTVSLPVIEFAKSLFCTEEQLYRALVVSNLVAIHQKKYIGSLSAYCGAVSAACGSGAAITYLYGGTYEDISATIVNTIGNVGGIVCDGAKSSCAAKIASAVDAAILGHFLGRKHHWFQPGEGIVQKDVEGTIKSMGYIGRVCMEDTDKQILNIMIDQVKVD